MIMVMGFSGYSAHEAVDATSPKAAAMPAAISRFNMFSSLEGANFGAYIAKLHPPLPVFAVSPELPKKTRLESGANPFSRWAKVDFWGVRQ